MFTVYKLHLQTELFWPLLPTKLFAVMQVTFGVYPFFKKTELPQPSFGVQQLYISLKVRRQMNDKALLLCTIRTKETCTPTWEAERKNSELPF